MCALSCFYRIKSTCSVIHFFSTAGVFGNTYNRKEWFNKGKKINTGVCNLQQVLVFIKNFYSLFLSCLYFLGDTPIMVRKRLEK